MIEMIIPFFLCRFQKKINSKINISYSTILSHHIIKSSLCSKIVDRLRRSYDSSNDFSRSEKFSFSFSNFESLCKSPRAVHIKANQKRAKFRRQFFTYTHTLQVDTRGRRGLIPSVFSANRTIRRRKSIRGGGGRGGGTLGTRWINERWYVHRIFQTLRLFRQQWNATCFFMYSYSIGRPVYKMLYAREANMEQRYNRWIQAIVLHGTLFLPPFFFPRSFLSFLFLDKIRRGARFNRSIRRNKSAEYVVSIQETPVFPFVRAPETIYLDSNVKR